MKAETEKQRQHYDAVGQHYYQARQSRNHTRYKQMLWRHFFKNRQQLGVNGMKLLEPMCGNADGKEIVETHLGVTARYEGFDYSPGFVARLRKERPDLNIRVQDITTFVPDREYDMIILIGGLHHIPRFTREALGGLNRALRPGGYFISFEATHNNRLFRSIRDRIYVRNAAFEETTEQAFEYSDLQALFHDSGFVLEDQFHAGLLSYILYYNPEAFPWLNIKGDRLMDLTFFLDRLFMKNAVGALLSFATLSLWKKPDE